MASSETSRPTSKRILIARLAEQVVAADPGLSPTEGRGRWITRDGERAIVGVVVAAGGAGRVDVDLHLVAHLPPSPLEQHAAALRSCMVRAAQGSGLGGSLGEVDIAIHDLREREEGG